MNRGCSPKADYKATRQVRQTARGWLALRCLMQQAYERRPCTVSILGMKIKLGTKFHFHLLIIPLQWCYSLSLLIYKNANCSSLRVLLG